MSENDTMESFGKAVAEATRLSTPRSWDHDLVAAFRGEDHAKFLPGLFPLAVRRQQDDGVTLPAAILLHHFKPACALSCRDAILAMLPEWDISIEEVVYYLTEYFGAATMITTVEDLQTVCMNKSEQTFLSIVLYWTKCFQQAGCYCSLCRE